ncbi:MAG: DUF389 domain-containing protein [Acidimicrobiales bacterium]
MLHLRIVSPPDRTAAVLDALRGDPAVAGLSLLAGVALMPAGDLVLCDVAREGANDIIEGLRGLNIHRDGSIAVEQVEVSLSDAAAAAESRAPGYGSDAAVWEEVDARVRDESVLTAGFLTLIVIAGLIAAVGLIEDAPILIVGAMVVGPEFGPIAGLSVGLFKRRASRIRAALTTLAVGLTIAAASVLAATALADALDLVSEGFSPEAQPLTGFIVDPSFLSFGVAFLAGIVGTLSLTQGKAGVLVGVLISVTTIPAVAAIGVSGALGRWEDALGATVQLALNLLALILAGVLTLWVQRAAWDRLIGLRPRRWS